MAASCATYDRAVKKCGFVVVMLTVSFIPPLVITVKVKAHELRNKTKSDLGKQLEELKKELGNLRVQRTTGGTSAKVAKIGIVRKNIARVLTVVNQKTKFSLREQYKDAKGAKLPLDLRQKKTRAIRRRLTPEQASKKTVKQTKKDNYYPKRVYAIRA